MSHCSVALIATTSLVIGRSSGPGDAALLFAGMQCSRTSRCSGTCSVNNNNTKYIVTIIIIIIIIHIIMITIIILLIIIEMIMMQAASSLTCLTISAEGVAFHGVGCVRRGLSFGAPRRNETSGRQYDIGTVRRSLAVSNYEH